MSHPAAGTLHVAVTRCNCARANGSQPIAASRGESQPTARVGRGAAAGI